MCFSDILHATLSMEEVVAISTTSKSDTLTMTIQGWRINVRA